MLAFLFLVLLALLGLFFLLRGGGGAFPALGGGEIAYLFAGGALVLLYFASIAGDYRGRAGRALHHAAIWLGLALTLIIAYSFRNEISAVAYRVAGEVLPPGQVLSVEPSQAGERAVRLRRHPSGHFVARGAVNGVAMTVLVDTGASTVVLRPADAERAGIDTSRLTYTVAVSTANGTTYAAPVRLRSVAIGPVELTNVEALVAQPGNLKENLLGMSFLRRLRSYEFSGDFLTLRG
jgi:aspartyl protease family protein